MASCYAFSVTLDRLKASNAFNFFRFIFRDNQHWFYDFLWFLIAARSVGGCICTCGFSATLYNRLSVSPIFCYRAYTHARTPCVLTVFHSTRKHYAIRFFNVIFNHESLVKQISHNQLKWLIAIQNEIDNKYSLHFFLLHHQSFQCLSVECRYLDSVYHLLYDYFFSILLTNWRCGYEQCVFMFD